MFLGKEQPLSSHNHKMPWDCAPQRVVVKARGGNLWNTEFLTAGEGVGGLRKIASCWLLFLAMHPDTSEFEFLHGVRKIKWENLFFLFYVILFLFTAISVAYGSSWTRESNWSFSCWPTPQLQQHEIQAASMTYTAACGNAGILDPLSEVRDWTCILTDTMLGS